MSRIFKRSYLLEISSVVGFPVTPPNEWLKALPIPLEPIIPSCPDNRFKPLLKGAPFGTRAVKPSILSGEFDNELDSPLPIGLCEDEEETEEADDEDDWVGSRGGVEPEPGELFPFSDLLLMLLLI